MGCSPLGTWHVGGWYCIWLGGHGEWKRKLTKQSLSIHPYLHISAVDFPGAFFPRFYVFFFSFSFLFFLHRLQSKLGSWDAPSSSGAIHNVKLDWGNNSQALTSDSEVLKCLSFFRPLLVPHPNLLLRQSCRSRRLFRCFRGLVWHPNQLSCPKKLLKQPISDDLELLWCDMYVA